MRNRKMKRVLAGGMAVLMMGSALGCGAETAGQGKASGKKEDGNKITFSMLDYTSGNVDDVPKTTLVSEAIKEIVKKNTGLEYEVDKQWVHMGDYGDKLKVVMAGGEIPDAVHCCAFDMGEVTKYGDQGMFVDFTQYKDLMPNLFKMIEKDSTFAERGFTTDGKLYILPDIAKTPGGEFDGLGCGAYRKDILDKHNLPIPTSLEELYEVATVLKKEYPEVYPIMTLEEWEPLENAVFQSYGIVGNNGDYFNGEEFVYSALEEGYKESIEYLNKLYTEGLIAPDYQIHTSEQGMAALANGEAFLIPKIWNGYPAEWSEQYPDQEWVLVPSLSNGADPAPFIYHPTDDDYKIESGYFTVISNDSPVKEELMKIYDQYYTEEKMMTEAWGIEGETYEVDEEGTPHIIDREKYEDINTGTHSPADIRIGRVELANPTKIYYEGEIVEDKLYNFWKEIYTEDKEVPYYKTVVLSAEENEEFANIMTAVNTYVDEQRAKFITGERPLDEWDDFIEELHGMGDIQKALDIKNSKL